MGFLSQYVKVRARFHQTHFLPFASVGFQPCNKRGFFTMKKSPNRNTTC